MSTCPTCHGEIEKHRAILKRIARLYTQLVDDEGSVNAEIARILDEMPDEAE